jgi:hypothetical protein
MWGAGALALFTLEGCGLGGSAREEELQRDLSRNRRLWDAQQVDDYRYVARRNCFCPMEVVSPVVVEVRDGEIASIHYQESGEPVAVTYAGLWLPMEGVFDIIQDAIDQEAVEVNVGYDAEFGFPRQIGIDYSENVVDEELGYIVEEFQLLEPEP